MTEPSVDIKATNLSELKKLLNETSDLAEQLEKNIEEINKFKIEIITERK